MPPEIASPRRFGLGLSAFLSMFACGITPAAGQELPLQRDYPGSGPYVCPAPIAPVEPSSEERARAGQLASDANQAMILGDLERAEVLLGQAADLDPSSADFAYRRARVLEDVGQIDNAMLEFCRTLSLDVESIGVTDTQFRIDALYATVRMELAADFALQALDALEAETDDQSDDILKYDPTGFDGLSSQDVADARSVIQDVQGALSAPTDVTLNEGQLDEFTFTLDAREFFVDPIADFKAVLPDYIATTALEEGESVAHFQWVELNLDEWTFPDPTFSGILPGITTPDLFELGFDGPFFEWSLTGGYYELITVDGLDCQADLAGGGSGCPVGGDFFYNGSLDVDGYDGMPEVWINLWGSTSVTALGSYDVVDNMDGTHTVNMDTVLQDGSNTPLILAVTFTDMPGYTSRDAFFRTRGGSTMEVQYLGSTWVFEKSLW